MQHNQTVDQPTFEALKGRQRHLITKPSDYQLDDSLLVTQENTRNQVSFAIISIEPLHSRSVILGLFAPYMAEDDLPAGVGAGNISHQGTQC